MPVNSTQPSINFSPIFGDKLRNCFHTIVRAKGTPAYGIGPARTLEEINSRFGAHSDDERISEESLKELVRFLWNIVIDIGAAG